MAAATEDRSDLWLPLLRRLTAISPSWVVWKNVDSALHGIGDIDAAAAPADWPLIEREFIAWAASAGAGPVVTCPHIPGGLNLVAAPQGMTTLLEMGVKARKIWRGATLFALEDLAPMVEIDPRGFRRLRPGAEGLFKFVLNGTRWSGRPDWNGIREKHVVELLRRDPEGAELALRLLGPGAPALRRAIAAAARGGWDRHAVLALQGCALARGLWSPTMLARRVRFRLTAQRRCPVVASLLGDHRRIPADRERWLQQVAATHVVHHTA
jgi:hypothetical protein